MRADNNRIKTAFVTVLCYTGDDALDYVEVLAMSARKFNIWLHYSAYKEEWRGFTYHKIEQMKDFLRTLKDRGYTHAMILDSRDTLFTATEDQIVQRYREVHPNDDSVLFNADLCGHMWPNWNDLLYQKIVKLHGKNGVVNGGASMGKIDNYMILFENLISFRDQLRDLAFTNPMVKHVHTQLTESPEYYELLSGLLQDDQFLLQITSAEFPESIKIDTQKRLFAAFRGQCREIANRAQENPHDHESLCDALIIHYPGLYDWQLKNNAYRNGILEIPIHDIHYHLAKTQIRRETKKI